MTTFEIGMMYVRACYPVTFEGVRDWLLEQADGFTEENADAKTQRFLSDALVRRMIDRDGTCYDLRRGKYDGR